MESKLTLRAAEIIHYTSDFNRSFHFFSHYLRWPVLFFSAGVYGLLDVMGEYRIALVSTRMLQNWEEGSKVPNPQLSMESRDLEADIQILKNRGVNVSEISGDPQSMLTATFTDPCGIETFIWQDSNPPSDKDVDGFPKPSNPESPYSMGECLYFVPNLFEALDFYTTKLEFIETDRHGDAYSTLRIKGGSPLGLMQWDKWFDTPDAGIAPAPPRLVIGSKNIVEEYQRLLNEGLELDELKGEEDGLRWFSFNDPDQNPITIWQFCTKSAR